MATEKISPLDKTSLRIDRKKMSEAQKLLGTTTIADTVDAALDEVISLGHRRKVMERIRKEGGLGPGPEELRRLRTP